MIYFIQARPSGHVKIGYTGNDPARRLAALQTGSPEPLSLLGSIDGGIEAEKALHARFAEHRLRPDGEWFAPADEVMTAIGEMLTPEPDYPVLFGKTIRSVYLAGKITRTTWRDTIAPGWSECRSWNDQWADCDLVCPVPGRHSLDFNGPLWGDTMGGHGSALDSAFPHAAGSIPDTDLFGIPLSDGLDTASCGIIALAVEKAIRRSDLVFAWIDSLDCYGTLFEIGYARSLGKAVVICKSQDLDARELWLSLVCADAIAPVGSPAEGWQWLFVDAELSH